MYSDLERQTHKNVLSSNTIFLQILNVWSDFVTFCETCTCTLKCTHFTLSDKVIHAFSHCKCMQDFLKHTFIKLWKMMHDATPYTLAPPNRWFHFTVCSGHFLNTTTPVMRYRAGTSHHTEIYKRPSRSMLPSTVFQIRQKSLVMFFHVIWWIQQQQRQPVVVYINIQKMKANINSCLPLIFLSHKSKLQDGSCMGVYWQM